MTPPVNPGRHHYLGLCRPGDVLITLLMELGDFLQTNVAKIAILSGTPSEFRFFLGGAEITV